MINYLVNQDKFIAIGRNLHDCVYDSHWVVFLIYQIQINVTLKFSFCFCLYLILFVYKFCIIRFSEVGCRKDICELQLIQGFNPMLFSLIEGLGNQEMVLYIRGQGAYCIGMCAKTRCFLLYVYFFNVCMDIILGQIVVSIAILNKYILFLLHP